MFLVGFHAQKQKTYKIRDLTLLLVFIVLFLLFAYYNWTRRYLYLSAAKMQGPFAWPIIGNALIFRCKHNEFLERITSVLETFDENPIRFWLGPNLIICLRKPQHIEKILSSQKYAYKFALYKFYDRYLGKGLITSIGGPEYRAHKRIIQPFLDLKFIESTMGILQQNIDICIEKLGTQVDKGNINIHDWILKCSVDYVSEIILGQKVQSQLWGVNKFVHALESMNEVGMTRVLKVWQHPDFIYNILPQKKIADEIVKVTRDFLRQAVIDSMNRRTQPKNEKDHFVPIIDRLIEYLDHHPGAMNEKELLDHLITLYIASDDTLAQTASFACLCFGMYPEYQKKAAEEIRNIVGDNPRTISIEDIHKMEYFDMCIKDSMRLFPVAANIGRVILEDLTIDEWTIPKGATVVLPFFVVYKDKKYWKHPNDFYPEHFLPDEVAKRPNFTFTPFSAGPRGCIGRVLAQTTFKILLANILLRYEIEADGKPNDIKLMVDISVRSVNGYNCRIKKRQWN